MGWAIGWDGDWQRDIGYGVPSTCDHPKCDEEIDRGLGCVCGGEPYGGQFGCGLFFCGQHLFHRKPHGSDGHVQLCHACYGYRQPYKPKADLPRWLEWKLTDESWATWRKENKAEVEKIREVLHGTQAKVH